MTNHKPRTPNPDRLIPHEAAMGDLGMKIAPCCQRGMVFFLQGELGVGKTTLVRAIMRGLGYQGVVKSPTYTLVESYDLADFSVHHFDLYRLADADELEYIGVRDYFDTQTVCLIEWAEKGGGVLPQPDVVFTITRVDDLRREIKITVLTERGASLQTLS